MTADERIAELEATVTRLEAALGDFMSPRLGVAEWTANRPSVLPNGDYPVFYRMRQIGISQDAIVENVVPALAQRIAALEARPAATTTPVPVGQPFPAGVQVVAGDVVFTGRVGFGGINPEVRSQVHIIGNDASILFGSNVDGSNWQSPAAHWATKSLSGDGGFRDQQNGYFTIEERDAYDPDGQVWYKTTLKQWIDPTRPWFNFGPDSRGDLSLTKHMQLGARDDQGNLIPPHEYTQDFVLKIYERQKEIVLESYRRGWVWAFGVDCKYGPARWWKAIFG